MIESIFQGDSVMLVFSQHSRQQILCWHAYFLPNWQVENQWVIDGFPNDFLLVITVKR